MMGDPITEHVGYCKNAEKEDTNKAIFYYFYNFSYWNTRKKTNWSLNIKTIL